MADESKGNIAASALEYCRLQIQLKSYIKCKNHELAKNRCWICNLFASDLVSRPIDIPFSSGWVTSGETINFMICGACDKKSGLVIELLKADIETFRFATNPVGSFRNWISGNIVSRV